MTSTLLLGRALLALVAVVRPVGWRQCLLAPKCAKNRVCCIGSPQPGSGSFRT
jgi:hypothetical protein